jgi:hypothetical protein
VSEGLRIHLSASAPLNPVVADRSGRGQTFFDVAALQDPTLRSRVTPNACHTVRLQFQPN